MVAPNGMHYVIRFEGSYNDALVSFSQEDLDKFTIDFRKMEKNLTDYNSYINSDGSINNKGVEKLLLETINNMGLSGKINLQRIDSEGIKNVNLDSNNEPTAIPCP